MAGEGDSPTKPQYVTQVTDPLDSATASDVEKLSTIDPILHRFAVRGDTDIFGSVVNAPRINQVDVQFFDDAPSTLLTESTTGGASSSQANGGGVFNSSTATTAQYEGKTRRDISYLTHHEIFAAFTCAWVTPPTNAGDLATIGLSDGSDGYEIGYKGSTFGFRHLRGGTEVEFVALADANRDALTGADDSEFQRAQTPVAIDVSNQHVYRIRFGWHGSAPTFIEVMSPDGAWVLVHVFDHTDLQIPQVENPNLPIRLFIDKSSSDATNIEMRSGSWTGGVAANVSMGQQPDGDFVARKASGIAVETSTLLGASEEFVSDWIDTDGWSTIEVFVASDVVSATNGINLDFSNNIQATTPVVRGTVPFEFTAGDVAAGFLARRIPTAIDGFRLRYKNGGTPQSSFYLSGTLRVSPDSPQSTLSSDISATESVLNTRGALFAENDAGQISLIKQSDLGGVRFSVLEHEAETPIEALDTLKIQNVSVGTTAVQIVGTPLTNRRSIAFKASPQNTKDIAIGTTSAVTLTSGYRLDGGSSVVVELSDDYGGALWAIAGGASQGLNIMEVGLSNPVI